MSYPPINTDQTREQKILACEKRLKEIEISLESQKREIQESFEEWNVSQKQIETFLNSPHHFSASSWENLQELKKKEEEKIKNLQEPLVDLKKTKKVSSSKEVFSPNWIHIH